MPSRRRRRRGSVLDTERPACATVNRIHGVRLHRLSSHRRGEHLLLLLYVADDRPVRSREDSFQTPRSSFSSR